MFDQSFLHPLDGKFCNATAPLVIKVCSQLLRKKTLFVTTCANQKDDSPV